MIKRAFPVVALLLAACLPSPPPVGQPVAIDKVCDAADGSRVRLDGYLRYRRGLLSFCQEEDGKATSCDLALYADATPPADFNVIAPPATGPEPPNARLTVPVGDGPGRMDDLPDRFSAADVKLHLDDKKTASEGDRVVVDGILHVVPAAPEFNVLKSCYVTVEWAKAGG